MIELSLVLPSIDGREHWCQKAVMSFYETVMGVDAEIISVMNKPTCGAAWNEGAERARGDYILFSADDITFCPGWYQAAKDSVDAGHLPCPRVLNPDGTVQSAGPNEKDNPDGTVSDLARVPFMSKEQAQAIFPITPIHYATDYLVSWYGQEFGWPTLVVRDFQVVHHFASEGRLDARLMDDMRVYWDEAGIRHPA